MTRFNRAVVRTAFAASIVGLSGISWAALLPLPSFSSPSDLNSSSFEDLSKLVNWTGSGTGTSMFTVGTDPVAGETALSISNTSVGSLTSGALGQGGGTNTGWTSLDIRLGSHVAHATNTITIDFNARWDTLFNSSNGENNRFIVDLLNNYPTAHPTYTTITPDNPAYTGVAPYGTQTYHLRIRPGSNNSLNSQTNGGTQSFLEYGGAKSVGSVNYEDTSEWGVVNGQTQWMPGFIAADYHHVETSPSINVPNFPNSSQVNVGTIFTAANQTTTQLTEFKYVITPTEQDIYEKLSGASSYTLLGSMPTPASSATAPDYSYYQGFDAIRLYFRDANTTSNTYISNFTVDVTAIPEPATLSMLGIGTLGLLRRRR